ncbi:NDP-sugar synthase [Chloroflexota bacterium]
MRCIILAGGFAVRLKPLIGDRPKPLLEIRGKPIITYIVEKIPPEIKTFVSTNRLFEDQFVRWLQDLDIKPDIVIEEAWVENEKLGALGSLDALIQKQNITEDVLVIAGDNYFEFDLLNFIRAYNGKNVLVAIYDIKDRDKAKELGVVRLNENRIIELREKPETPFSSLVSTGCYILPPRVFKTLADYCATRVRDHLGEFIAHLVEQEDVYAYVFSEKWLDIGTAEAYLEAQRAD